jgi:hypothetical protein
MSQLGGNFVGHIYCQMHVRSRKKGMICPEEAGINMPVVHAANFHNDGSNIEGTV